MKLDKETLIKQRFWFIAGAGASLTLLALVALLFFVPRSIAKNEGEVGNKQKKVGGVADIKNPAFIEWGEKEARAERKKEGEVWKEATKGQQILFFWPRQFEKEFHFQNGKFALEITVQAKDAELKSQPADQPETKKDEKAVGGDKGKSGGEAPAPPGEDKAGQERKGDKNDKPAPDKGPREGKGEKDDKAAKEEDKGPADKSSQGEPAAPDSRPAAEQEESPYGLFHGRLVKFDANMRRIEVVGRDGQRWVFHEAPQGKVTVPDEANKSARFVDLDDYAEGGGKAPPEGAVVAVKYSRAGGFTTA